MKIRHLSFVVIALFTLPYAMAGELTKNTRKLPVASVYVVAGLATDCNEGIVPDGTETPERNKYLFKCVNGELERLGYRTVTRIWLNRLQLALVDT